MSEIKWPAHHHTIELLGRAFIVEPSYRGQPFIYLQDKTAYNNIQWNTSKPFELPDSDEYSGNIWTREMFSAMCEHFNVNQTRAFMDGF